MLKLSNASLVIEVTCHFTLHDCARHTQVKVPISVFDQRGVTVDIGNIGAIARLLPDGWYAWEPYSPDDEISFVCEKCKVHRGMTKVNWNDKLVQFLGR